VTPRTPQTRREGLLAAVALGSLGLSFLIYGILMCRLMLRAYALFIGRMHV
jgi:hypothetical protein